MSDYGGAPLPNPPPPRRRRPRQGARHPFPELDRNNFPGLDPVLKSLHDETPAANRSVCSSHNASLMDMSIGARASMTEHLRHIAKFGLDGGAPDEQQQQLHPSDEEWNQLLDGSEASWANGIDDSFANMASNLIVQDELDSIEVIADVSIDFFNSSRIYQLSTPEKNKNVIRAVTTRSTDASPFEESESGSANESEGSAMMHMFKAALNLNVSAVVADDRESSFVSFSGVDVSRISGGLNDSFGDPRRSPDQSVDCFHPFDVATPSRTGRRDFSFSTPGRSEHNQLLPSLRMSPPSSLFAASPAKPSSHSGDNVNGWCLSPIAATAGRLAGKALRRDVVKSPDQFPDMSDEGGGVILGDMDDLQGASPIPITNLSGFQINSLLHLDDSILSEDKLCQSRNTKDSGGGSSRGYRAGNSGSVKPHHTPLDRRLFRTVVPHRVFMDEPSDFPEQADDSFSIPSKNTSNTSSDESNTRFRSTSLLQSFDDAAQIDTGPEHNTRRQAC
jgi:hypothetical protein